MRCPHYKSMKPRSDVSRWRGRIVSAARDPADILVSPREWSVLRMGDLDFLTLVHQICLHSKEISVQIGPATWLCIQA